MSMIAREEANFVASVERSRAFDIAVGKIRALHAAMTSDEFESVPGAFEFTRGELDHLFTATVDELRTIQRSGIKATL